MRQLRDSAQLREHAVALRREGKSVRQIKQIMGPIGNRTLHDALRGEPPPEWTRRPNAKDALRASGLASMSNRSEKGGAVAAAAAFNALQGVAAAQD